MSYKIIVAEKAPKAIGPYSHGVKCKDMIYTSGQIPLIPETGELETDVKKATLVVLNNLLAIVEAGGGKKEDIAKMEIFVRDLKDFNDINVVYQEFFGDLKPARYLVQVAELPKDSVLEAAATAYIG